MFGAFCCSHTSIADAADLVFIHFCIQFVRIRKSYAYEYLLSFADRVIALPKIDFACTRLQHDFLFNNSLESYSKVACICQDKVTVTILPLVYVSYQPIAQLTDDY